MHGPKIYPCRSVLTETLSLPEGRSRQRGVAEKRRSAMMGVYVPNTKEKVSPEGYCPFLAGKLSKRRPERRKLRDAVAHSRQAGTGQPADMSRPGPEPAC